MAIDLADWVVIGGTVDEQLNGFVDSVPVANCVLLMEVSVGDADPNAAEKSLKALLDQGVRPADRLPIESVLPCARPSLSIIGGFFTRYIHALGNGRVDIETVERRVDEIVLPLIGAFESLDDSAGWYEFEAGKMGPEVYQWGFDLHVYGVIADKQAAIVHIGILD